MANPVEEIQRNIDPKIVTSVVVGSAIFGIIIYAAVRSGIKPLKSAAKAAAGGK